MAGQISSLSQESDSEPIANINVTPFVDVALVLLVIFMITAPMLVKETLDIRLPKSSQGAPTSSSHSIGIAVTAQGQILLSGVTADDASVVKTIAAAKQSDEATQVLISADGASKHSDLVHVIDLVKQAGVSRFALQVVRP